MASIAKTPAGPLLELAVVGHAVAAAPPRAGTANAASKTNDPASPVMHECPICREEWEAYAGIPENALCPLCSRDRMGLLQQR